eukprot:GILK01006655.1.p1 GENE.GILK01006655.1~~GILK01006655.1.p1  ORF type:complete len:211 (+),score=21.02 GILK01006655.1:40-672(+)
MAARAKADVALSKALTFVLRHGAVELGLNIQPNGFIALDEVLRAPQLRNKKVTLEQVQSIVENCDKKRFELVQNEEGVWMIRAVQGHSIQVVKEDELLVPITDPASIPCCVHGTQLTAWTSIQSEGLRRMTRNHIHFAAGLPNESGVISGMRQRCQVHIYVDIARAIQDGIPFFQSRNGVILTPGVDGVLPPTYFTRVISARDQRVLHPA